MRVLALTSSFPHHQSDERSIFVKRLYDALDLEAVDLTVVSPHPYSGECKYRIRTLTRQYRAFGDAGLLRTICAQPASSLGLFQAIAEYRSLIDEIKPDVVHANWSLAGIAASLSPVPSLVTLRGSDIHLLNVPFLRTITRAGLSNATVLSAVGSSLAETASESLRRSIIVIENGTELAEAQPIEAPQQFFLAVGTVSAVKGIRELVRGFANFAKRNSTHHLVVAGRLTNTHYVNIIRQDIERFGLNDRIHLLGSITPGNVTYLLGRAAAFCGFSVAEGRPNAVLEAKLAGVPCVLSRIPAHEEIFSENDIIANVQDPALAASALENILAYARRASDKYWTWKECAARYLSLLKQIG